MRNNNKDNQTVSLLTRSIVAKSTIPVAGAAVVMLFTPLLFTLIVASAGLTWAFVILLSGLQNRLAKSYVQTEAKISNSYDSSHRFETTHMREARQALKYAQAKKRFTFKALSKAVLLGHPITQVLTSEELDSFGGRKDKVLVASIKGGVFLDTKIERSELGLWKQAMGNAKKLQ